MKRFIVVIDGKLYPKSGWAEANQFIKKMNVKSAVIIVEIENE